MTSRNLVTLFITLLLSLKLCEVSSWQPKVIHFVSSCHLGVGFADTAPNIVNRYFDKYFAASIGTSEALRERGGAERLVFLTHTYLVSLYLNCPPSMGLHCPSQDAKDKFIAAIKKGDIVWHAMPFNSELELLDPSLVDFSIQLTHDLDKEMGRNATITMSQRDVPGTTRSIIPHLTKNGVQAITVGVNGASMPPEVPSIFRWKDETSGEEVIAMWHPGGYGGQSGVTNDSIVAIDGVDHALAFGVRGDNSGPPSSEEVIKDFANLKKLYPNATVVASDYDAFVKAIMPYKEKLPVYTQEIGDTWIYGVPSDPWKVAAMREIMTARTACLASGKCSLQDQKFYNFSRLLLKGGEHTWGLDVKSHLKDWDHWTNDKFHSVLNESNFITMVNSWLEQRAWAIDYAVAALEDNPLRTEITSRLELLRIPSTSPDLTGFEVVHNLSTVFSFGENMEIGFSPDLGAITHLIYQGKQLATGDHPLANLVYQTFTTHDYEIFESEYLLIYKKGGWMDLDFGKHGLENTSVQHQQLETKLVGLWHKQGSSVQDFWLQLSFPQSAVTDYGAPASVWLGLSVTSAGIDIVLQLVNKTATRIPEALFLQFRPVVDSNSTMMMDKVGELINVLDVISNGSKHLHSVGEGITYGSGKSGLWIKPSHTPITCIGEPTPFPVPMATPDISDGFAFNIVNNIWGTNYVMWFPFIQEDASTRYQYQIVFPTNEQ